MGGGIMSAQHTFIFEPHGGLGTRDPDGEWWPAGYLSLRPGEPVLEVIPVAFLGDPDPEVLVAAARLVDVAPALLEALKDVLAYASGFHGNRESFTKARAVIARAEGQS
jgi:hypothetical protein